MLGVQKKRSDKKTATRVAIKKSKAVEDTDATTASVKAQRATSTRAVDSKSSTDARKTAATQQATSSKSATSKKNAQTTSVKSAGAKKALGAKEKKIVEPAKATASKAVAKDGKSSKCAIACKKDHKHTAACKQVCSSSKTRKSGTKARVRTAHSWREQLMNLVSR